MSTTPVFDRKRAYGDIFHGGIPDVTKLERYMQDGHYFRSDGTYMKSDPGAKMPGASPKPQVVTPEQAAERVAASQKNTLPGVDESNVEALLKDPRAAQLLMLPRDHLIQLVNAANGPTYAGEGSTQLMVAWLVENTLLQDVAPKPAPAPAAVPTRTIVMPAEPLPSSDDL